MEALHLIARAACALPFIAAQIYLTFTLGVASGFTTIFTWHVALQVGAAVVAPAGFRTLAAIMAGWMSIIVGIAMFLALVTIVVPFSIIAAMDQGDFSGLWGALGGLAFLAVSAGVVLIAFLFDQI